MIFSSDAAVARIALGVRARSLPKPDWTHAAHFAAAVHFLADPAFDAWAETPGVIRAYNEATGVLNTDEEGYHETITLASLGAAASALEAAADGAPLFAVVNDILAGPCGRSDWPLAYWSRERLFSPEARRDWLAPDLATLPFAVRHA
ncbi:MAG: hypothetical protein ACFB00_10790 [Parvularculaceae bacterium]